MGWFIGGAVLLLLAVALVIDTRDHSFRLKFSRKAAREGRRASYNDAVQRGLQMQERQDLGGGGPPG